MELSTKTPRIEVVDALRAVSYTHLDVYKRQAYPSGLCAERTTLFYANSQYPDQPVVTLDIAARTENDFIDHPIPPCGCLLYTSRCV